MKNQRKRVPDSPVIHIPRCKCTPTPDNPLAALEAPLEEPTEADAMFRIVQYMTAEPDNMACFFASMLSGQGKRNEGSRAIATAYLLDAARKYAAFRRGGALKIGGDE